MREQGVKMGGDMHIDDCDPVDEKSDVTNINLNESASRQDKLERLANALWDSCLGDQGTIP